MRVLGISICVQTRIPVLGGPNYSPLGNGVLIPLVESGKTVMTKKYERIPRFHLRDSRINAVKQSTFSLSRYHLSILP